MSKIETMAIKVEIDPAFVTEALKKVDAEFAARADLVARQLFLLTNLPPSFCAQIGVLVRDGLAMGQPTPVDGQLNLGHSFGRTADDVANFCADVIESEAPEAAARLRGFFR